MLSKNYLFLSRKESTALKSIISIEPYRFNISVVTVYLLRLTGGEFLIEVNVI